MGNGIFKTLVVAILLAAAAFLCGSFAADGIKSAIVPILLLIGAFVLIYLGKNCWWILYLTIPAVVASIGGGGRYLLMNGILLLPVVYWLIMTLLGRTKVTWYGVPLIDISVAIYVLYFLLAWFRNPVRFGIMLDRFAPSDHILVGGADYLYCFFSTLAYISISIIPVKFVQFTKVLKYYVWVALLVGALLTLRSLLLKSDVSEVDFMPPAAGEGEFSRNFSYIWISMPIIYLLACKYSLWSIVQSPWKLLVIVLAGGGLAISGYRFRMMIVMLVLLVTQWLHRKLIFTIILITVSVGGVILLSSQYSLDFLPYGVKRVLAPLPGIKFDNMRAVKAAQASTEWRFLMWKWALDPSKGYIKNYIWGDGLGARMDVIRRESAYGLDSKDRYAQQKAVARHGNWHNGSIVAIHRIGIVGLCIVLFLSFIAISYFFCTLRVLDFVIGKEYVYFALMPILINLITFYLAEGNLNNISHLLYPLAMLKICYCHLLKEGKITPWFSKKTYVPLMVRELNGGEAEPKQA